MQNDCAMRCHGKLIFTGLFHCVLSLITSAGAAEK